MIQQEKLEWMKSVGITEFKRPMKYSSGLGHLYSEEYIKETPLEKLKAGFEREIPENALNKRNQILDLS